MNGRGYKKCPKMWGAIQKYGWDNIKHETIYSGLTKEQAETKERELIVLFDSIENGYNIEHGGNALGTHNIETRRKISTANKGKTKPPCSEERKKKYSKMYSGSGNPFYGRVHTEETKAEHSKFMRGNQYNKGHHHTDEYKKMKSKQMHEKYSNGGNPRCKPVSCIDSDGIEKRFVSLRKAAEMLHVNVSTLYKYVHSGKIYKGCTWSYINES